MDPNEVAAPEQTAEGDTPLSKAGEFGAVLLGLGHGTPTGAVRLVWELTLDRVPPPTLTFAKPKAWLAQCMKNKKGNYYMLARA